MDSIPHKELILTALGGWAAGTTFGVFGLLAMAVLGGVAYLAAAHAHRQYEVYEEAEEETEEETEEDTDDA